MMFLSQLPPSSPYYRARTATTARATSAARQDSNFLAVVEESDAGDDQQQRSAAGAEFRTEQAEDARHAIISAPQFNAANAYSVPGRQGSAPPGQVLFEAQPSREAVRSRRQGQENSLEQASGIVRVPANERMPRLDLSSLNPPGAARPRESWRAAVQHQYPAAKKLALTSSDAALVAYPGDPREHPWAVRGALFHGSTGKRWHVSTLQCALSHAPSVP